MRDSEGKALRTISTIRKIQAEYASKNQGKFADSFDELIRFGNLDWHLSGNKSVASGYVFELKTIEPTGNNLAFYSITADPQISEGFQATGSYHFYLDSKLLTTKVTEENRQATADDPSI